MFTSSIFSKLRFSIPSTPAVIKENIFIIKTKQKIKNIIATQTFSPQKYSQKPHSPISLKSQQRSKYVIIKNHTFRKQSTYNNYLLAYHFVNVLLWAMFNKNKPQAMHCISISLFKCWYVSCVKSFSPKLTKNMTKLLKLVRAVISGEHPEAMQTGSLGCVYSWYHICLLLSLILLFNFHSTIRTSSFRMSAAERWY